MVFALRQHHHWVSCGWVASKPHPAVSVVSKLLAHQMRSIQSVLSGMDVAERDFGQAIRCPSGVSSNHIAETPFRLHSEQKAMLTPFLALCCCLPTICICAVELVISVSSYLRAEVCMQRQKTAALLVPAAMGLSSNGTVCFFNLVLKWPQSPSPGTKLLCGSAAGVMGQTVSYPFDVVRRRL